MRVSTADQSLDLQRDALLGKRSSGGTGFSLA